MNAVRVVIYAPIWGHQKVGVAEWRLMSDIIEIDIVYKDKKGRRVYPSLYRISKAKALTYPVQVVNGGTRLRVIPIADFQEIVRVEANS